MRLLEGKTRGGQSGNLEAAAFLHRSAAEFGPDVIHRAFDFSAPRGAAVDQIGWIAFLGGANLRQADAEQAKANAGFAGEKLAADAKNNVR